MPVYKDKNGWSFRTYVDNKQYKRSGFETKKEAIQAEANFKTLNTNKSKIIQKKITFNMVYLHYISEMEKKWKITTLAGQQLIIKKNIIDFFKNCEINDIDQVMINRWRESISKYSINYKNKLLIQLKAIIRTSNRIFFTTNNIVEGEPPFKDDTMIQEKKIYYTSEQFALFQKQVDNLGMLALFTTLFYTGLRIGEIRALKWTDINFEDSYISVSKSVTNKAIKAKNDKTYLILTPKSKSSVRKVYFPADELQPILFKHFEKAKRRIDFNMNWFVFGDDHPYSETNIRRQNIKYAKRAKLPIIRIHDYRHSYISMLYKLNVDVAVTKEQAGHASIQTTMNIYTHLSESDKMNAINEAFKSIKKHRL